MDAVGGVNLQFRAAVFLHNFVHAGRAVPRFGRGVFAEVDAYRGLRVSELQVDGLVFLIADVGEEDAAQTVESQHAVGLGIVYRRAVGGFFQAAVVGAVVADGPRRAAFEQVLFLAGVGEGRPHAPFEGRADVADFVQFAVQPALFKQGLVTCGFATAFGMVVSVQHGQHGFGGQHARFHGGVYAFDARHV